MVWLGRIVGGVVGFVVAVIFTEVIFANSRETEPLIATTVLVIAGVLTGSWLARHFTPS